MVVNVGRYLFVVVILRWSLLHEIIEDIQSSLNYCQLFQLILNKLLEQKALIHFFLKIDQIWQLDYMALD